MAPSFDDNAQFRTADENKKWCLFLGSVTPRLPLKQKKKGYAPLYLDQATDSA